MYRSLDVSIKQGAHKGYWNDQNNRKAIYKYVLKKNTQYMVVYVSGIMKTEGDKGFFFCG